MNGAGAIACFIVGLDCIDKANGAPQHLFAADVTWIWWIVAACWIVAALKFAWTWWQE